MLTVCAPGSISSTVADVTPHDQSLFLTCTLYVPGCKPVKVLDACHAIPSRLYSNGGSPHDTVTLTIPSPTPHALGFVPVIDVITGAPGAPTTT